MVAGGDITLASDINNLEALTWVTGQGVTASSAAIGATETVVLTAPSYTYKANSAYRISLHGGVTVSVATNTPLFRFRKTNTAGQQFDVCRVPCISTSSHGVTYDAMFQVGGADVTAVIVATLTGAAGFNATLTAAATSPCAMDIFRVGREGGIYAGLAGWAPVLV